MSLVGGPNPFSPGGVSGVLTRASDRAEDMLANGRLGAKVTPQRAAELSAGARTGYIGSSQMTTLDTFTTPNGYDTASVYLVGTRAYAQLQKGRKSEWRDLGPVTSLQSVHHL